MLTERKVFLGCMMAVGLWAETVGAKPVEVIRPEDEAILEGVFELDGASAQQKRPSPMADGNGVAMKGARDATRIKAVPLNVTFGENASGVVSATTSSKEDKKDASVTTSVDNTQEMTVEVNSGADLKNTMKTVVEGDTQKTTAPVEKVEKKTVKTTVKTINAQKADETSESATENASEYRYQDEIGYTYPSKSEREQARQPLNEWYNPNLRAADTYKTETKSAPQCLNKEICMMQRLICLRRSRRLMYVMKISVMILSAIITVMSRKSELVLLRKYLIFISAAVMLTLIRNSVAMIVRLKRWLMRNWQNLQNSELIWRNY